MKKSTIMRSIEQIINTYTVRGTQQGYGTYQSNEPTPSQLPEYSILRDQYIALKKVCDVLELHFGRLKSECGQF
jgi:hypothetical protein